MRVRAIYKPDKSVSIIYPALKSRLGNENEAQWLKRVFAKITRSNGFEGLPYDDLESSQLPGREGRDAWEGEKGKGVYLNEEKAALLTAEKARQALIDQEKEAIIEALAIKSLEEKGVI